MPVGISVRGDPHAMRGGSEPEPEPESEVIGAPRPPINYGDPGAPLAAGLLGPQDVEHGADGADDDAPPPPPLSPADRLRRSAAHRRDQGHAGVLAAQTRLQDGMLNAVNGSGRSRCLFAVWLALLLTFLLGFVFLLAFDINQWLGAGQPAPVAAGTAGNIHAPVTHCDPAKAGGACTYCSNRDNQTDSSPPSCSECSGEHYTTGHPNDHGEHYGVCSCWRVSHPNEFADKWIDAQLFGDGQILGDDDFFTYRLPFPFTYYGKEFKEDDQIIMVSSNGYFTFGAAEHYKYGNTETIPHAGVPDEMVAVYWSDFDPTIGQFGGVAAGLTPRVFTFYREASPGRRAAFAVEWARIAHLGSPTSTCTFEAILYEDGDLSFLYDDISQTPNDWSAPSIGFEDSTGVYGAQIAFNDPSWPPRPEYALTIPKSCHSPPNPTAHNQTDTAPPAAPPSAAAGGGAVTAGPTGKHHPPSPADTVQVFGCGLLPCEDMDAIWCPVVGVSNWCEESFRPNRTYSGEYVCKIRRKKLGFQGQLKCHKKNGFDDPRKIQISGRCHSNPAVSRAKGARNVVGIP